MGDYHVQDEWFNRFTNLQTCPDTVLAKRDEWGWIRIYIGVSPSFPAIGLCPRAAANRGSHDHVPRHGCA
jgi:hypothetical protein